MKILYQGGVDPWIQLGCIREELEFYSNFDIRILFILNSFRGRIEGETSKCIYLFINKLIVQLCRRYEGQTTTVNSVVF